MSELDAADLPAIAALAHLADRENIRLKRNRALKLIPDIG